MRLFRRWSSLPTEVDNFFGGAEAGGGGFPNIREATGSRLPLAGPA